MEHPINTLEVALGMLNSGYNEFVVNGSVSESSLITKDNRRKAKDCEKAIKILKEAETSEANLNIGDVVKSLTPEEKGKNATLEMILKGDSGYRSEETCRISADQYGRIQQILNEV